MATVVKVVEVVVMMMVEVVMVVVVKMMVVTITVTVAVIVVSVLGLVVVVVLVVVVMVVVVVVVVVVMQQWSEEPPATLWPQASHVPRLLLTLPSSGSRQPLAHITLRSPTEYRSEPSGAATPCLCALRVKKTTPLGIL